MIFELFDSERTAPIAVEESAYEGVKKIAYKVAEDITRVTNVDEKVLIGNEAEEEISKEKCIILVGTIGKSARLDQLIAKKKIEMAKVEGRREVYLFQIVEAPFEGIEKALVIAGSDKRGTIYGLFHISELLGVSPWVEFGDVVPKRQDRILFDEQQNMVSKEPSIKYRGFFINDEWPAFGTWTNKHYSGFTAKMYDKVFELLLRLKGNYLWPAMWSSSFSLDGPGMESAILADQYGIVMCNSHHEPCLRHSEEWDMVRGNDSVYGNEWNYRTNKEGLLRYWEEGLKRNGQLENVITIGMRGERDTSMLGENSTLKENIDLLKDIITEQRNRIKQYVNSDLSKVPQMLALYKEVEQYFYGDQDAEGLVSWDGIDGVTCMLCEDNFGNMRTLPTKDIKERNGGWGMYYHFDYHGGPVSYEWINTSYLPKVWEQMTMAYDFGVREIWVVNVGDLKLNEFPLHYFMDLAYDFERYGTKAINQTSEYTDAWIHSQFGGYFEEEALADIKNVIEGYTRISHNRRTEALHAGVYHPVHERESEEMIERVQEIMKKAENLLSKAPEEIRSAFFELVYFPAAASMNVVLMQLYAGLNAFFAAKGAVVANEYAAKVSACIEEDRRLVQAYHALEHGKWDGMALSEHIGFQNWNDEGCVYPLRIQVEPANKPRILVASADSEDFTTGDPWTRKEIHMRQFMQYGCRQGEIRICCGSREPVDYQIECNWEGILFSKKEGTVHTQEIVTVSVADGVDGERPYFVIKSNAGEVKVVIERDVFAVPNQKKRTFVIGDTYAAIEASHYAEGKAGQNGSFKEINDYGRTGAGIKAFPSNAYYTCSEEGTYVTYRLYAKKEGSYTVRLYTAPANPVRMHGTVCCGLQINEGEIQKVHTISDTFRAGESGCAEWANGVLNQIHIAEEKITLLQGENSIRIYACDPGFVLEKLVVLKEGYQLSESYLGPKETGYQD